MLKKIMITCCATLGVLTGMLPWNKKAIANNGQSLLWKVTGGGLQKPSYLFGTIHLICPDDYLWTKAMQQAYQQAEQVAFELDMDDPTMQAQMATSMAMEPGKTLRDYYTPEDYDSLSKTLKAQTGLPVEMLEGMKPFAVMSILLLKTISCTLPDSYEGNIMKLAHKDKKEIVGLESVEDQVALFDQMNADTLASLLLEMAGETDSLKSQYNELLQAYKAQDLPAMYALTLAAPDFRAHLDALLFDRNKKWIPSITRLASERSTFIAVGAGHLWGEMGVISLLRQAGYTVEAAL